jgi:hypothetical protein
MVDLESGAWREIAEQASAETNPAKMMILVRQLCMELDKEESVISSQSCDGRSSVMRAARGVISAQRACANFRLGLGLSRASIHLSNSADCERSRAARSIRSTAVSRNFSASRRSCSEIGLSGIALHDATIYFNPRSCAAR